MAYSEEEFRKRLFRTFLEEALEHVQVLLRTVRELEAGQADSRGRLIEQAMKEAHTLKGAARSAEVFPIEATCQAMESMLAKFPKEGALIEPDADWRYVLEDAVDALAKFIDRLQCDGPASQDSALSDITSRLEKAHWADLTSGRRLAGGGPVEAQGQAPQEAQPPVEPVTAERSTDGTVRVSMHKMGAIMAKGEELLLLKQSNTERLRALRDFSEELQYRSRARRSLAKDASKLRQWLEDGCEVPPAVAKAGRNILEAWDAEHAWMQQFEARLDQSAMRAANDEWSIDMTMDALLSETQGTMMMPCELLFESFPPMIRELAREQGKRVSVQMQGLELEVDRRVLDEIKGGLIHILRNAVDHGLEPPEQRLEVGKDKVGSLTISARALDAGKVEIVISDDGRGIDLERLKTVVERTGGVSTGDLEDMSDGELERLIFRSGVSTSPFITDISGRGVGLSVLEDKVERLGGQVDVTSVPGQGTTFRIRLPMSMARFNGLLARARGELYAIPTTGVDRVYRIPRDEIKRVENVDTVAIEDSVLELFDLGALLEPGVPGVAAIASEHCIITVLCSGGRCIACVVDEIVGVQEILIRTLGPQLASVPNVLGATVLADGSIVPIINVSELVAASEQALPERHDQAGREEEAPRRILVAEDSVTSRTLLRNILESAGYSVTTAVNGREAASRLEQEPPFDLVVTDVEMPEMNGLELTAHIRNDQNLAVLPVVIVSTLNSPEDRERGATVGANAYLVKSNFEQGSLLETVRRLI